MDVSLQHDDDLLPPRQKQQLERLVSRRGLLRVALEASPLQQTSASPCSIRSVAICNFENPDNDRTLVYLGTDSGDIQLFTWCHPSRSAALVDANSPAEVSDDVTRNTLSFSCSSSLGLTPVDCLCTLPRAGAIIALLDKQIAVLDLFTLHVVEWLSSSKGAFAVARAYGYTDGLQFSNRSHNNAYRRDGSISPQTPRKNTGQGQLAWLFGSTKRSGSSSGTGDLQNSLSRPNAVLQGNGQGLQETRPIGVERFAVAIRQTLLLYEVTKESKKPKEETSITIRMREKPGPDEVVTMAWIGNAIITGNYQEYMLHHITDGHAQILFTLPQDLVSPPLLKTFPKDLEVLLLMDAVGMAVNASGNPTSSSLIFKDIPDAVGQSSTYVVAIKRGVIELYHRKTGAKVQSILLSDARVAPHIVADDEDGKFLMVSSAYKIYCLERVPLDEQLKELLRQRQIDEALALAEESSGEIGVENAKEKVSMVHAQAGFLLFFDLQFKDAVDHFLQSSIMHPAEVFPFFPDLTTRWRAVVPRVRYWGLHPPPQAVHSLIESKLQAIQRGRILQSLDDQNDIPNGHALHVSSKSRSSIIQEYTIDAIKEMIRYLMAMRSRPTASILKEGIDTLLIKLFLKVGITGQMEAFTASQNDCLVEEVASMLKESGQLRALAFLYETKGMQSHALEVWQALSLVKQHSLQATAAKEASRLLKTSSDGNLVLAHLKWILKVSRDEALQVLCSSHRTSMIPPDDVLNSLDEHEVYVQQRYLQWLLQEQGVNDPHYHTLFAVSHAKSALDHSEIADVSRETLQQFLETSDKYDPNTVLDLIRGSSLWHEQAILHRKLGDEMRVFQIYALKLGDIEAAERYCTELGKPDAYMRLLDLYLKPGEGKEPMYDAAVHLLQLHGTCLDPLQVLEALSPDMPFQLAYGTIARLVRTQVHMHREGQIVQHLRRAENFETRIARLQQRNRFIQITEQSSCRSCFARFGTKLFALYPNDSAVCYKCFRNAGSNVDPVTGQKFGKDMEASDVR